MSDSNLPAKAFTNAMQPANLEAAMRFCDGLAQTEMVPPSFKRSGYAVYLAIIRGEKLGLDPFTALQNIAVINGRPQIYGDAPLALVQRSPAYEWHKEDDIGAIQKTNSATCTVKRKGSDEPYTSTFDKGMAETAGLWGKSGPWKQYPWRMLQLKARRYALSSQFAAELEGFVIGDAEKAEDDPDVKDVKTGQPTSRPVRHVTVHPSPGSERVSLAHVLGKIENVSSSEELEHVADAAKKLSPEDAAIARQKFIDRRKDFSVQGPPKPTKSQRLLKKVAPSSENEPADWQEALGQAQQSGEVSPQDEELFK